MGPDGKEITHDDMWDDSALVRSWNEALDEYKVRAVGSPGSRSLSLLAAPRLTHLVRSITASMQKEATWMTFSGLLRGE